MARIATNQILQEAKKSKSDEFYTQLCDIENELCHYESHFNGKVVYCNCDDPRRSNFYRYFALNFKRLGIKKLIASWYSEPADDLFASRETLPGGYYTYSGRDGESIIPGGEEVCYFEGSGDFRKQESLALLKQSDIVVTNPPFSLFREFIDQMVKHDKKFLVIGNINCLTYKNIFALIKENKAWLGVNLGRGISGFIVPDHYELYGTEARIDENGHRIIATNNCLWLTNLDLAQRHEYLELTKQYVGYEAHYPTYDNFNGINVNQTKDIPLDYTGAMGVPITFLHKFNPDQFEIVKFRKGDDEKDLSINGKCPYFRILIRHRKKTRQNLFVNG